MKQQLIRQSVLKVGESHKQPRIWIEGLYLERAGFNKGDKINVKFSAEKIEIDKNTTGAKLVCGKKTPLIDINNSQILQIFQINDKIKVIVEIGKITITRTKLALRKLLATKNGLHGELFAGGGLMTQAFKKAGYETAWAVEKNEKYANIWQKNHEGSLYNSDIAEIQYDELQKVEVISGGIPCENFSVARQNSDQEAETMDLSIFFVSLIEKLNPRTIVLEEVPMYLESEIGIATIRALQRLGYNVESKIVSGNDYGEIQCRKRAIVIASYDKIEFPKEIKFTGTAKDILQDPNDPECQWFTKAEKQWIWDHNTKQKAKGNNFQMVEITGNSTTIPTLTKRYNAIIPSMAFVKHPTEEKWRLFTITEQKRLFGLPDDYDLGEFKTTAGEVMGQGILVSIFQKIAEIISGKIPTPKPEKQNNIKVSGLEATLDQFFKEIQ